MVIASDTDGYSKLVRWAKLILPVLALGLIVSIFAFSKPDAIRDGSLFTDAEMAELAEGQKITNPNFAGVTLAGDAFTVEAETALPDAPKPTRIDLVKPAAEINTERGLDIASWAEAGVLDIDGRSVTLSGSVSLSTSSGYSAQTEELILDFETGNASSPGRVVAQGPIGSIESGSFLAEQSTDPAADGKQAVLYFKKGVKLIYVPKAE